MKSLLFVAAVSCLALASSSPLSSSATAAADCESTLPWGESCPQEQDNIAWRFADPDHCSRYYECVNGCSLHLVCQEDQLFDEEEEWCTEETKVSLFGRNRRAV